MCERPVTRTGRSRVGLTWCGVVTSHLRPRGFDSPQLHRSGSYIDEPLMPRNANKDTSP